jgi:hypothetical protein
MATQAEQTDMGIGFAVIFSLLTLLAAGVMLVGPTQLVSAWGFAAAMAAASIAVVAAQVYWD